MAGGEVLYRRQITLSGRPLELVQRYTLDDVWRTFVFALFIGPTALAEGPQAGGPVCLLGGTQCQCLGVMINVFLHGTGPGPPRPVLPSPLSPFAADFLPNSTLKLRNTDKERPARTSPWFSLSRILLCLLATTMHMLANPSMSPSNNDVMHVLASALATAHAWLRLQNLACLAQLTCKTCKLQL